MNKYFWIDKEFKKTFEELVNDLNQQILPVKYIKEKNTYDVFLRIIHSLINDYPIVLLDGDFTNEEIVFNKFDLNEIYKTLDIDIVKIYCVNEIYDRIRNNYNWNITLLTSGTTGIPKRITHNYEIISKAVKTGDKYKCNIWAYAYNPTHMAGLQLFLQAFMNQNTMVNIFKLTPEQIAQEIKDNKITHISATPTFYKLFIGNKKVFPSVIQISIGGESSSATLIEKLHLVFPNARIRNIYASTEAGSLLASDGDVFILPKKYDKLIKIVKNELIIHHSLLGESINYNLISNWYYSGDLVEIIEEEPRLKFRFINRKNNINTINVGGYKVNPEEIEEALLKNPKIIAARVYGRKNSVIGNILCADIVAENISEYEIRQKLELQSFKIPRIIKFVDRIEISRTGKII